MLELLGEASQFSNLARELQFSRGDAMPFLYVVFLKHSIVLECLDSFAVSALLLL